MNQWKDQCLKSIIFSPLVYVVQKQTNMTAKLIISKATLTLQN